MKFKRKTAEVDALFWNGMKSGIDFIEEKFPDLETVAKYPYWSKEEVLYWVIKTNEISTVVGKGDWIVRDSKGNFEVMTQDIFFECYEEYYGPGSFY